MESEMHKPKLYSVTLTPLFNKTWKSIAQEREVSYRIKPQHIKIQMSAVTFTSEQ
jgi:hypothetical protein